MNKWHGLLGAIVLAGCTFSNGSGGSVAGETKEVDWGGDRKFNRLVNDYAYDLAVGHAQRAKLFESQELRNVIRRAIRVGKPKAEAAGCPGKPVLYLDMADAAKSAFLATKVYNTLALKAFDSSMQCKKYGTAEHIAHEFGLDEQRHEKAVVHVWGLGQCCSHHLDQAKSRHPLTNEIRSSAFPLLVEHKRWKQALTFATQLKLEGEIPLLRTKVWRLDFDRLLKYRGHEAALDLTRARVKAGVIVQWDRVRPVMLEHMRALEKQALYGDAVQWADAFEGQVDQDYHKSLVSQWFDQVLVHDPMSAFRMAKKRGMASALAAKAKKAAFEKAQRTGNFQIAKKLPDGTFMIVD